MPRVRETEPLEIEVVAEFVAEGAQLANPTQRAVRRNRSLGLSAPRYAVRTFKVTFNRCTNR